MSSMRQIIQVFEDEREKSPLLGDYIILTRTARRLKLTREKVFSAFNRLVPSGDYAKSEKEKLVNFIMKTSR